MIFAHRSHSPRLVRALPERYIAFWATTTATVLLLLQNALAAGNVTLYGQYADESRSGGRRIAVNHYPEIARRLAESGQFDLVCYGHTHRAKVDQVKGTVLANPGEIMGRFGAKTLGLYDCSTGEFTLHDVRHYPKAVGA